MSPEMFLDIFQEALKTIVIMVAFIIIPGLLVGLVVPFSRQLPLSTNKL